MNASYEIVDRFGEAGDASALLYAPLDQPLAFRQTRRYEFEIEGDTTALGEFVRSTLFDPISQELHAGDDPALGEFGFVLEYGMKPGVLDLEKEAIVAHYHNLDDPGFDLLDLRIRHCIYVIGDGGDPDRFIRDICNPAIQNWSVTPSHA